MVFPDHTHLLFFNENLELLMEGWRDRKMDQFKGAQAENSIHHKITFCVGIIRHYFVIAASLTNIYIVKFTVSRYTIL